MKMTIRTMIVMLVMIACSHAWAANNSATHKQIRAIAPQLDGRKATLHTFCVGPDSNLWMCCEPAGATAESSDSKGAVLVYSPDGQLIKTVSLSFAPQAINFSPRGTLFVAGSGKIAKLSSEGTVELEKDAPNIGNRDEMIAEMKRAAQEQLDTMMATYDRQLKEIEKQIVKLEEVPDDETEKQLKRRERRLKILTQQREQFQSIKESLKESLDSQMGEQSVSRLMRATGLAATDKDIWVSLPVAKGYGYAIYRMNHDLDEPKVVLENVSGCCGQLDIQSDGENLLVAENTSFQVGVYDRDGNQLKTFGKRGSGDAEEGFGSCCNPMNVRCCANGEILTAESSIGNIKRFSKDGEYLGFVGQASIGGGCKHVAIGFDSSRNWHYMMNIDRSQVAVLVPIDQAPSETDEERESREAKEGLGKNLLGTWELVVEKDSKTRKSAEDMSDYFSEQFGHVEFAPDGSTISKPLATSNSRQLPVQVIQVTEEEEASDDESHAAIVLRTEATATESASGRRWMALRQNDGKLDFVIVDEGIRGYGATVEFVDDSTAKFTWFYGSAEQPMSSAFTYKRTTTDACGQKCTGEACEEKKADAAK